jgi:hypothetical protein
MFDGPDSNIGERGSCRPESGSHRLLTISAASILGSYPGCQRLTSCVEGIIRLAAAGNTLRRNSAKQRLVAAADVVTAERKSLTATLAVGSGPSAVVSELYVGARPLLLPRGGVGTPHFGGYHPPFLALGVTAQSQVCDSNMSIQLCASITDSKRVVGVGR